MVVLKVDSLRREGEIFCCENGVGGATHHGDHPRMIWRRRREGGWRRRDTLPTKWRGDMGNNHWMARARAVGRLKKEREERERVGEEKIPQVRVGYESGLNSSSFARLGLVCPPLRTAWRALSNKSENVIAGVTKTLVIMRTRRLQLRWWSSGPGCPFCDTQSEMSDLLQSRYTGASPASLN
jgi:hypothetical protein